MKKFFSRLVCPILLLLASFSAKQASASHAAGGEIIYEWVSGTTYKFYFKFYRDCAGIAEPASMSMCYGNTCNSTTGTLILNKSTVLPGGGLNGQDVVVPCPQSPTTCNNGSYPGYKEWWYENTLALTSQCNYWHFSVWVGSRNAAIDNYVNASAANLYIDATLNNVTAQGNSSPYFTVKPVPYVCINQPYTYNNGAVDPNGDSMSFDLIMPRGGSGCGSLASGNPALTFQAASPVYNLTTNPLPANNTFFLDATTGQMSFTPTTLGEYVITLRAREFRNGIQIGQVMRDIQIVVIQCVNPQPAVTVQANYTGLTLVNGRYEGCATQVLNFSVNMVSPSTSAVLVVTDNSAQAMPGSSVSYGGLYTPSATATYSWLPSPLDTGLKILTITVKDSNCINGGIPVSQTFSVPIYIWPITLIKPDTTICRGDSVQLEAIGGGNFQWTVLPGGSPLSTLSCTNCKQPWASPLVTTKYVVTSNLSSICNKNKDTVTITVPTPPQFNLGPDRTVCINEQQQLNINLVPAAGSTYSISWIPSTFLSNDTIANPVANPTNDITWIVKVTPNGLNKCAQKDTLNFTVLQGYTLWNGKDTALCLGKTVNINMTGDNRYTYTWAPPIGVSNVNSMTPTITPDTSRTYTVKATYPGCQDSVRSIKMEVEPVPVVYAGPDRTLCTDDTVKLDMTFASPASYPNYIYSWSPPGGFDNPGALHPVWTAALSTQVILTVTTPKAFCSGSDGATYTVIPGTFITASLDTTLCPGDTAQLHITGGYLNLKWTPAMYMSDSVGSNPYVYPYTSTNYTAIATDAFGCRDTENVYVRILPRALVYLPDSVRIYPGDTYTVNLGGNGLYFGWFPPLGLSNPNISNPVMAPEVNTRYFVNVRTEDGCTTSDSMDVLVSLDSYLNMPNAFSPGSAPNSKFSVQHLGNATLKRFTVFNRWGVKVFETTDLAEGWDGAFKGEPQPMGVYIYTVDAVTHLGKPVKKQGNVTLIR